MSYRKQYFVWLVVTVIIVLFALFLGEATAQERPVIKLENAVRGCRFKVYGDRKLYTLVYVTGKKPSVDEDGQAVMEWWVVPKDAGERSHNREGATISDNVPEASVLFYSSKWGRVLGPQGCKCPPWNGDAGASADH